MPEPDKAASMRSASARMLPASRNVGTMIESVRLESSASWDVSGMGFVPLRVTRCPVRFILILSSGQAGQDTITAVIPGRCPG